MCVALLLQRVYLAGVNNNVNAGFAWILGIVLDGALNTAKAATNIGDHHVADNKLRARVRGVDLVGCFQLGLLFRIECARIYLDIKIDVRNSQKDSCRRTAI